MPAIDSTAAAALNSSFAAEWFIFLDISGDPLRVTTGGKDKTFASTGDSDLDGHTFTAFGGKLLEVGDVQDSENGADTVDITLSGIVGFDDTLLADIGNKALWQGRECRIWFQLYDETGVTPQGAIVQYYTGYMSKVGINAGPKEQKITLSVEKYLAFYSHASNRSYLNQSTYDAADTSAQATITAANGLRSASGGGGAVTGGGGNTAAASVPISIGRQAGG